MEIYDAHFVGGPADGTYLATDGCRQFSFVAPTFPSAPLELPKEAEEAVVPAYIHIYEWVETDHEDEILIYMYTGWKEED